MAEPLILSASSISTWLRCRRMYLYAAIYRVSGPQNLAAALGAAVHEAVDVFWRRPERPTTALKRRFDEELTNVPEPYEEPVAGILADGRKMLGVYMAKVAPAFTPTMVEQEFLVSVAEVPGILVAGTIDAADEKTDEVHDLKTITMISKFSAHWHALQMNLYALGYRAMTGRPAKRLLLDVLTRKGNVPYRQVEVEQDIGGTLDVLGVARDAIMAGDYSPTGADNGSCRFCPYTRICQYARLD